MSNKRTYTTMNSDTTHIKDLTDSHNHLTTQQPSKRRRTNKNHNNKSNNTFKTDTNSINSPQQHTNVNLNLNINHNNNLKPTSLLNNHNQKYQEQNKENINNNRKPIIKNLNNKRITTPINNPHFTSDFTHTPQSPINNSKYLQQKQRLLTQTPSPITSPESSISVPNQLQLENTSSNSSNSNSTHSDIISRRKIKFEDEINNKIHTKTNINKNIIEQKENNQIETEYKTQPLNIVNDNNSFDVDSDFDNVLRNRNNYRNIFGSDMANGIYYEFIDDMKILHKRKAFRNYVLSNLNDDKEYCKNVCFIFGVLFLFWGLINLF
eukprot:396247_1